MYEAEQYQKLFEEVKQALGDPALSRDAFDAAIDRVNRAGGPSQQTREGWKAAIIRELG